MAIKSIESTFVYRHLNSNNVITESIMSILKDGTPLTKSNLEEAVIIINKNFKYPLKLKVMESLDSGIIKLVYSPAKSRIPTAMPFFLTRDSNGRVVAVVMVDLIGKLNIETMTVNVDAKKLYTIMESALLAVMYHERNREITKRNVIISSGASIYSNMFTRVLNKKYALNTDKNKMNKVLFLSAKFYMLNVLGLDNGEIVTNYALKNCPNGNIYQLRELDGQFPLEAYSDLSTFIIALASPELALGFKDLSVRGYLESYITMYDGSALFALEVFPYFMYTVMGVVNGAYLNNQFVLEDIVDRHGAKMYTDLLDFVR